MPDWNSQLGTLLFLCLLFRGALSACTTSTTEECCNAGFVPGSRLAGQGYDVVTLQPKGAFVIDVNTWHTANGSCTLCDNELLNGVRQRLPISLVDWRTLSSCRRSVSSQLYRSAAKLAESASSSITNNWHADLSVQKPEVGVNVVLAGSHSKMVKAESGHKLTIEVWDQDDISNNDLLGKCQVRLTSGNHCEVCYLKYGKVTYAYTFTCGLHLGGATCQDYTPGPGSVPFTTALGGTNRTLLLNTHFPNTRSKSPIPII
ncbi:perforin-1-like [Chiloscyllium plagiosum]|uniref:perforin-1-like n=1 Tax=Chiloscyllium plagiosum TaxID=36176 RepID=UPI001CB7D216|nr:perforin-1-like [Chiloscyllium plagiosum]